MAQQSILSAITAWWRRGRPDETADDGRGLGVPGGIGVLIEAIADPVLVLSEGRVVEANRWSERVRGCGGPAALLSEEWDVQERQMRGNLPQAFVHALFAETARVLAGDGVLPAGE